VERETLLGAINKCVKKGGMVCNDEVPQYNVLKEIGYEHEVVNHSQKEYVKYVKRYDCKRGSAKKIIDFMATTNSIESVWALLKLGFYGTFHKFAKEYLQGYLNEFAFRLNDGNCKYPTIEQIDSLTKYCVGKRITYRELVWNEMAIARDFRV
jgi:hypothetical protein